MSTSTRSKRKADDTENQVTKRLKKEEKEEDEKKEKKEANGLMCPICFDPPYGPILIQPCAHTICVECAKQHFGEPPVLHKDKRCPKCPTLVTQLQQNFIVHELYPEDRKVHEAREYVDWAELQKWACTVQLLNPQTLSAAVLSLFKRFSQLMRNDILPMFKRSGIISDEAVATASKFARDEKRVRVIDCSLFCGTKACEVRTAPIRDPDGQSTVSFTTMINTTDDKALLGRLLVYRN